MNLYRAGATTDDTYAALDNTGSVLQLPGFALTAPSNMTVTLGVFEAGIGFHFTVAPDATLGGTSGEIIVAATGWRDVIPYSVVESDGGALCTREQVKARGVITTAGQDALIDSLIPVVLPKVSNRYGCEFMPHSTATRTFDFDHRLISLVASDLRSATSVVLDPNGTPRTLVAGTDYILVPRRLTGTCEEIMLAAALGIESAFSSRFGMKQISITGEWGIWGTLADVPADIQEAAVECVLSWMQKPVPDIPGLDSSAPRQIVTGAAQTWDIPASAHRAFQPYNRVSGIY